MREPAAVAQQRDPRGRRLAAGLDRHFALLLGQSRDAGGFAEERQALLDLRVPGSERFASGLGAQLGVDDVDLQREVDQVPVGVFRIGLLELLGRGVPRRLLDELEELVPDLE
jgi:hypothetical protein